MIRAILPLAIMSSLAFYTWTIVQQRDLAEVAAVRAAEQRDIATEQRDQMIERAARLAAQLDVERAAQQLLRETHDQLRGDLRRRQHQIEELKRENQELREWADQPLPDAARRLRERPSIVGAGAYREHLSRGSALPTAGERPP